MNPEISCPIQDVQVSTSLCFRNESGMCLQNSSVPINAQRSSVSINISGLCAREKYCSDFSILDRSGAIVNTGSALFFSKLTK